MLELKPVNLTGFVRLCDYKFCNNNGLSAMTHPLTGKTLVAYIRVSKDTSDSNRQKQSIESWLELNKLFVTEYFTDDIGSNSRDKAEKRKSFQKLFQAVEQGGIDAIIVDSQDRFGFKDNTEFWAFIHRLRQHGVELWSISQGNLSQGDDATIFLATVGAITSTKEVKEKGYRSLTTRLKLSKEGKWAGGYPAYGIDVICFDSSDKIKWRLVWTGKHARYKIDNDGNKTEYNGANNLPGRDKTDIVRYAPSIVAERLDIIRQIFNWYATESISCNQIATRLNLAKVDSVFGDGWNKQKVKEYLRNPVYIGLPSVNKRAGSRYWEYVNGQMQVVEQTKGKVKAGRRRQPADFIGPDKQVFQPIIDVDIFNKVQRKLQAENKEFKQKNPSVKAPRVASFWLRNVLFCSQCDKPMRAWNSQGRKAPYRSYFCGNYGTYGKNNPTNCKCNRVKAELLENIVDKYLSETHSQIVKLIEANTVDSLEAIEPMEQSLEAKRHELKTVRKKIINVVDDYEQQNGLAEITDELTKGNVKKVKTENGAIAVAPVTPPGKLYSVIQKKRKPLLEKELAKLDKQHSLLVKKYIETPSSLTQAIEKIKTDLGELEQRMTTIKSELVNQADKLNAIAVELIKRKEAIEQARQVIATDASYRVKGQIVRRVIAKVVAHFAETGGKGNRSSTTLTKVEVFPVNGSKYDSYPDGNQPGQDSFWMATFYRLFDQQEIDAIRGEPWQESVKKATEARKRNAKARRQAQAIE